MNNYENIPPLSFQFATKIAFDPAMPNLGNERPWKDSFSSPEPICNELVALDAAEITNFFVG